jgi:osmotically-inducible protein OsmY
VREVNHVKTDLTLQDQVQQELRWDSRLDAADIGVAVQNGAVTLSGTVKTFAESKAGQEAAFRVAGVRDVANDIHVKIPGSLSRSDADIAQAVRAALEWDITVPSDRIRSSVSEGVVTLFGTIDDWHQVAAAERAVSNLAGVIDVLSELVVHGPSLDSTVVQAEIEEALERRADRAARRIAVSVHDGTVTLDGTVHSWAEKEAVLGAARGTQGVRIVADHLRVEPPLSTPPADEHLHAAALPL